MRVVLKNESALKLKDFLKNLNLNGVDDEVVSEVNSLIDQINNKVGEEVSQRKKEAMMRASKIRQERVKEKVQNALDMLLKSHDKNITMYQVSKFSGVSYHTISRKYKDLIEKYKNMKNKNV